MGWSVQCGNRPIPCIRDDSNRSYIVVSLFESYRGVSGKLPLPRDVTFSDVGSYCQSLVWSMTSAFGESVDRILAKLGANNRSWPGYGSAVLSVIQFYVGNIRGVTRDD